MRKLTLHKPALDDYVDVEKDLNENYRKIEEWANSSGTELDNKFDDGGVSTDYDTAKKMEDKIKFLATQIEKTPIGTILPFASGTIPKDYLLCDGREITKNNYPELYDILPFGGHIDERVFRSLAKNEVPNMTGPTLNGYTVTESSVFSGSFRGWKAFDSIFFEDNGGWASLNGQKEGWVQIQYPNKRALSSFAIRTRKSSPGSKLEKISVYGITVTSEDELFSEDLTKPFDEHEKKEFKVNFNKKTYDKFKIKVSAPNDQYCAIDEIELFTVDMSQFPNINQETTKKYLPDLRGQFLRGIKDGRKLLAWENEDIKKHNHKAPLAYPPELSEGGTLKEYTDIRYGSVIYQTLQLDSNINDNVYGRPIAKETYEGSETRPSNIGVNYIIKAKNGINDNSLPAYIESLLNDLNNLKNNLTYTNNAVFKEEYKDITSEYHITHPDKYCAITNNRDSIYNTILNETAECVVNVYKVKKGDKFKVTSVLSMGNFPVCIYLDSDFRLIQKTKKLPSNFGYSQQTNEFIVDNDYPYVLLTSRYTALFKVEKVLLISKVPTKTSELINDNNFIIHKDMEKYVDNKFITVNQSINLYDSSKSIEGFMSEKDKIEVNSSYMTSDFIKLEKGNYVIQQDPKINETARITYTTYDKNKKPVTFLNKANINNLVVNMNTDGYLRFSTYTKQMQRRAMVFKGEQPLTEYIAFKTFESLNENITSDNILWNKKWAVCGDSFTNGVTETKIKSGRYEGKQYTYPYLIGNRQNMDIRCFFRGGRTLAYSKDGSFNNSLTCPTSEAYYKNIPVDVDYITIYLGINDSHHATGSSGTDGEVVTGVIPIGTIDDIDTSTYYGAWNVILTWLIENRPFAHIGIIVSNGCDTPEYRTAQLSIAKKYGIPYIDLNGDERTPCMIRSQNQKISQTIRNMITKKQAVDFDGTLTGSVNLHPNDQAHLYESYFIENFLRNL